MSVPCSRRTPQLMPCFSKYRKRGNRFFCVALILAVLIHRVVRNEVHICQIASLANKLCQLKRMLPLIVHILQQNVLQRDTAIRFSR